MGGRKPRVLSRQVMAEILQPRAEEIFTLIHEEVVRAGFDKSAQRRRRAHGRRLPAAGDGGDRRAGVRPARPARAARPASAGLAEPALRPAVRDRGRAWRSTAARHRTRRGRCSRPPIARFRPHGRAHATWFGRCSDEKTRPPKGVHPEPLPGRVSRDLRGEISMITMDDTDAARDEASQLSFDDGQPVGSQHQGHRRRRRRRQRREPHDRRRRRRGGVHRRQHRLPGAAQPKPRAASRSSWAKLTQGPGRRRQPRGGPQRGARGHARQILEALTGADMVFVTAGLGGGTGTGAAPIIANLARELGALVVAVVTKPFAFEGRRRRAGRRGPARAAAGGGHRHHDPQRQAAAHRRQEDPRRPKPSVWPTTSCARRCRASPTSSPCPARSTSTSPTSRRSCRAWAWR